MSIWLCDKGHIVGFAPTGCPVCSAPTALATVQPAEGYQKIVTPRAGDQRAEAAFPESCCEGAPDD